MKAILGAALGAAISLPIAVQAALYDFTFTLDVQQHIDAAVGSPLPGLKRDSVALPLSPAFGAGFARYDDVKNQFVFVSVSGTGLLGNITQQHIHIGAYGVEGDVALNMPAPIFNNVNSGDFAIFGTNVGDDVTVPGFDPVSALPRTFISQAEETQLLLGNAYLNIRTSHDGAGEIRGQMTPVTAVPEPDVYGLMLAGLGLVGWAARRRRSSAR